MRLALENIDVQLSGTTIFSSFDLAIEGPGITVVLGRSGIGKTTLLRVVAGLLPLASGRRICDAKIATMFQDSRLLPWQSALDNAGFGLRAAGMSRDAARKEAETILQRLGLGRDDQLKRPDALSGGMRKRVAIARALAVAPNLLLLDEPFASLDPTLRTDLYRLIRALIDETGISTIIVTHDLIEAATLADRIVILGHRPAQVAGDISCSSRTKTAAEGYARAAELMQRAEIAYAF